MRKVVWVNWECSKTLFAETSPTSQHINAFLIKRRLCKQYKNNQTRNPVKLSHILVEDLQKWKLNYISILPWTATGSDLIWDFRHLWTKFFSLLEQLSTLPRLLNTSAATHNTKKTTLIQDPSLSVNGDEIEKAGGRQAGNGREKEGVGEFSLPPLFSPRFGTTLSRFFYGPNWPRAWNRLTSRA